MARSYAHDTSVDSCDLVASTDEVRSTVRSKLPSRVRGVEQLIVAPSDARKRDRDSIPLGRRVRAPGIPMSSRTFYLLGHMCKPLLAREKRSKRLALNSFTHAPK